MGCYVLTELDDYIGIHAVSNLSDRLEKQIPELGHLSRSLLVSTAAGPVPIISWNPSIYHGNTSCYLATEKTWLDLASARQ